MSESIRWNLAGTTAIVTGASRGLGRAYAHALARAGASVVCVGRGRAELERAVDEMIRAEGQARACVADVSSTTGARDAIAFTVQAYGTPDLLVNNAGILGPLGPLHETDADEWWRCLETNLGGPMRMMNAVLPGMLKRNSGRIVNVASGSGTSATPYLSGYVTGKTALIRLTETVASEIAGSGVKVFAIEPGTVRTKMAEEVLNSASGKRWLGWFRNYIDTHECPIELAANFILLLAGGAADKLSGKFLSVHNVEQVLRDQDAICGTDALTLRLMSVR
jgi:NAD(P)-dependent dehydrogenase (short-subunit alcohol dehydrogenase family)